MRFDQKAYGARIRKLRISHGLTQEQLAEKASVSRTSIVKIENGTQSGSIELATELAELFHVPLDYLLLDRERQTGNRKREMQRVIAFLSELEKEL